MLKGTLKDRSLESEILDNVLRTVKNIDLFDTENLEPYKELAYSLSKYSRITKFIECLEKFINRSEFIKADKLKPIQEERTIITLLKNSTLISFIVGMLILIPEKYKPSILNSFFTLLGNGGLIIIIILLFYWYIYELLKNHYLFIKKEDLIKYNEYVLKENKTSSKIISSKDK